MVGLRCRRGNLYSSLPVPLLVALFLALFAVAPQDIPGSQNESNLSEFLPVDDLPGITENLTPPGNGSPEEFMDVDEFLGANETLLEQNISEDVIIPDENVAEEGASPEENGTEESPAEDLIPLDVSLNETPPESNETALPFENNGNETLPGENEEIPVPPEGPGLENLTSENMALLNETSPGMVEPPGRFDIPPGWEGELANISFSLHGSDGKEFPAAITLRRAGSERSFEVRQGIYAHEIPRGKYDISIIPGKISIKPGSEIPSVPVEMAILHGADLSSTEGLSLGLESLSPNSLPFGKNARQAYAIDPSAIIFDFGELTVRAKGKELLKCAEWDFAAQECSGEWIKIMDLTPGELYTIAFNSTDPAYAEYDYNYGAPACNNFFSPCIAGSSLLYSRDSLATPEPNQPNTVDTCADGASGTYMADESVENITITDLNGSIFNAGDWVRVDAYVYCYDGTSDNINFVYSNTSASPVWRVVNYTDPCPAAGFQNISTVFRLDNIPGTHVVRVINQYNGVTTATCGTGAYDDNDDLAFQVNGTYAVQAQDAIIAYRSNTGTNTLNSPKIRFWNSSLNGSWGPEIELPSAGSAVQWAVAKWSPIAYKVAVITLSADGYLDAYVCREKCDLAGSWFYSSNIGSVGNAPAQRRFDFEFETTTGDLVVVYGINSTVTTQDLAYKVLPANQTTFSGIPEQYIDDGGHGTDIQYTWVRMDRNPTASEEMLLVAFDSSDSDINAWVWNGSAWGNQISITDTATATGGYEALAVRYAADGSKGMAIGGSGTAGAVNTRYWNGTAWSAITTFDVDPGDANDVRWANLKADPSSDDLQGVFIDSGSDLATAYWSGSAWTVTSNIDTGVDTATARCADFEWNASGSVGRLVWDTDGAGTTLSQRVCAPQCTATTSTISTYAGTGAWITMWRNPSFPSSQVRILSARLNSNFDIGSFLFNGTAYANYGDGAITADTTVSTYEAYSIAFNITDTVPPSINFTPPTEPNGTVIYVNYTFINTSITDNMGVYAALLEWNGTNESMNFTSSTNWYKNKSIASYGIYAYKVWARDYVGNWNVSETRTIIYGSPPSVVVIDPHGEAYPQDYYVPIAINATDPDGISLAVATVTLPNGSTENVTLYYSPTGDNFGFNTIGIGWVRENLTGPGQTCISDINDTVPEQAYISLSGNGLPETDTLCTLISHNALYGNFDMEITFTLLPNLNADTAINFQLTEQQTSAEASKMAFIALSNWTGLGRNYEVFADDGNQSGYLSTRETEDTHGKFRITRSNNTFTFYTWNNSGSSWTEEASSTLNLSKALFVSFEAESAYPGWGTISASFDNLSISGDNYTYSTFNNTNLIGLYNISFYVRDSMGAVNNSERTNFTVYFANHRPSKPFILAPSIGSYIYELFNITWSTVTDEEGDNVLFNITLLNPDYSFNQTIISDYGNLSTNKYEWDTSTVPDGVYSLEVLVYENETPEQLSNYYVLPGTFTVNNSPNVPPSLIILSPLGENYTDFKPVPLAANITDIDGINESYAIVTYPNGSTENITLYKCRGGDNFDMDTVGLGWFVENSTSPSQTCIADINTTIPGKAYTYISGNGAPMSDTLCSLVSHRGIYGDFDMNISFEILSSTSADNAFNFQVMEVPSSANATFLAFIALSNWTGMGRNYEVFVDDGTISGYIATVPTNDTYGKFRIKREGNNFTFYVWNNTGSSWIELNSTELNLIKSLHVAIESESAYPGWGSMEVAWDNLTIAHDNDTFFNEFNTRTHAPGDYNVSFYARDNRGGINDTEKSNFTVVDENDPPSKPFLLTPSIGSTVSGLYNITWSAVYDPDENSVWFNITLLNPDGSDNATIVSDYGNISINHYTWDTTAFPDGEYSMRIVVFENETPEHLSNSYTLPGTFVVHNSVPSVEIINPHGEDYPSRRPVPLVINASSAIGIDTAVAEVTLPNGSVENLTLGSGLQGDNFSTDTMGNPWFVEDSSIGHSQNCIADIDTTIPGRAYTYLYGDGTPQADTLCSIISNKAIYGDFDISISFNVESEAGADYALNFQVSRTNASAGAQSLIFFALSNWTGLGRNYEIYADDGNFSDYILSRPTDDTSGKFRIRREGNNFAFYTWNNSGSSWVEENVSQNEFDFAGAVYVTFESESAYPGWGAMEASWDNFTVEAENYTMGMFWGTETPGVYNVTFAVNDTYGGTNATEKTNFTIVYYNSPPGTPYLLSPWPGENVSGVYQITWSEVANFDDDNLQFNITLLNADFSYNSTIATNYGNKTSTSYDWDTSTVPDGIYSMEITVFENETPEQYSNSYTLLGNFTVDNTAPSIQFEPPTETSGSTIGRDYIMVNVSAADPSLNVIEIYLYNASGSQINVSAGPTSPHFANFTGLPGDLYYFNATAADMSGHQNWTETRNVTITSFGCAGSSQVFLCGMPVSESCTMNANLTSSGNCFNVSANDVEIDCAGHSIAGVGSGFGIYVGGVSNFTLKNCVIGNYNSSLRVVDTNNSLFQNNTLFNSLYGLYMDPSYNNTIIENQMFSNSAYGLYLENSHNNTIRNNTAWDNSLHGFFLNQSTNNILSNNTAYNNSQHGFYLYYSNFNNLTNNTARNNANAGFQIEFSNNNSLDWNLAHDDYNGFYVQQSSQNNLTNNDAYNNTYDGFYLDRCSGNLFQFNHVYDNANVGFDLDQSTDMVLNNTMYGHIDGLYVYESSGNVIAGNIMYGHDYAAMEVYYSENNTIANNSVLNSTSYGFLVSGARNTILSGNYVQDIGQFDALSIAEANNSIIENNIAHNATNNCFGISYSSNVTASNNTASACNAGFNVIEIYGSSFSNNTANESAYGFYVDTCSNNTFSGSVAYNNSLYGFYLYYLNLNNISGNIARNNTGYGIYFNASGSNSLIGNNITWNGADGLLMAAESDSNSLYSNYVCFNNGIDLRNQNATNSGDQDTCDSHFLWDENGHPGCTYMCTEVWHRFMGNVSGNILLAPSSAEIFYSWVWNGQHGRVYAANGDASIQWINLTALGRNTSGLNSTHDFEELDFLLGYENLAQDNVNATFSSDGSNPKETATMRIFKRDVPFIPVAQSAWNSSFRTGIVWDASQGGPQFNTTLNQDVVFVVEMNTSQDYNYQIMVPGTLDTYKGGSGVINIWVELD